MNKISLDAIEKAANRIAAQHYFSNVETETDIEKIWNWATIVDDDVAFSEYSEEELLHVWFPFQHWAFPDILDSMIELRDSIVEEMTGVLE